MGSWRSLAVGPDPIAPDEVAADGRCKDDEDFEFEDQAGSRRSSCVHVRRFNEMPTGSDNDDPGYDPRSTKTPPATVVEDWSVGFMRAVGMRREAWEGVLETAEGAKLFIPIVAVASLSSPDIEPEDIGISTPDMDELLAHADTVLAACVVGLNGFWRERSSVTRPRLTIPASRTRKPH